MGTKSTAFSSLNINEPYRATRLWNEIVKTFRSELPRKVHRKRLKTFEDCFVASEAVDWLLNYLRSSPHFGPTVSRQQASQLLQKFLQTNLIQEVTTKKKSSAFEDNKDLYRIKKSTPLKSPAPQCLKKLIRTPLTEALAKEDLLEEDVQETRDICLGSLENKFASADKRNSEIEQRLGQCSSDSKTAILSPLEISNIWKSVLWNKLSVVLNQKNLESVLEPSFVQGHVIMHNVSKVQKSGIVALMDKSDDIPNWIMCAMKCLAKWPNASGSSSCLPNYPGFEKDVFKVVQEYFLGLDDPLIPYQFFGIIAALYEMAASPKTLNDKDGRSASSCSIPLSVVSEPPHNQFNSYFVDRKLKPKNNIASSDTHLNSLQAHQKPLKHCASLDTVFENSLDKTGYCFETVFANENPVTQIVRRPSYKDPNNQSAVKQKSAVVNKPEPLNKTKPFLGRKMYRSLDRSACGVVPPAVPQRSASMRCLTFDNFGAQGRRFRFERRSKKRTGLHEVYYEKPFDPDEKPSASSNDQVRCSDSISIGSSSISADSAQLGMIVQNPYVQLAGQEKRGIVRSNSSVETFDRNIFRGRPRCRSALGEMTGTSSDTARPLCLPRSHRLVKCFQLVLLLVVASNRRKLHLLLRFLNRIKLNTRLQLFSTGCSSLKLSKMFWTCIFKPSGSRMVVDELLGCQVTEFLLDHCEAILAPPIELKIEVSNVVMLLSQSRMRQSGNEQNIGDLNQTVTFCEQVTSKMYEDQKQANLHTSLRGLLEEILTNPLLTGKDRTKKLQKFRKQYPEVYSEKFPPNEEMQVKRRSFFKTLKNIRL